MKGMSRALLLIVFLLTLPAWADHVIVTGGPALRKWEDLRVKQDQHDRWWANFIRASTIRMDELRKAYGPGAKIIWLVYKPGYTTRASEDGKPYTTWITEQATKRKATIIWFHGTDDFIRKLNARPRHSIQSFDFFGHSNRHAFMFDYGNFVMAASTAWLHERDLRRIRRSIFDNNAYCKSWGCHTGESMSETWRKSVGVPLEGAKGPTDYTVVGKGILPIVKGRWAR
ncbi:MAG: hypothetical protein ACQCXQ_02165 [Verrucomicrobiales bacterium]